MNENESDTSKFSKKTELNKDEIKLAFDMLKNEHPRWNQWILFFLGSQASIFFIYDKAKDLFETNTKIFLITFCVFGIVLSILWIFVSLNLRASTRSWQDTIKDLENGENSGRGAWSVYKGKYEVWNRSDDFKKSLNLFSKEFYIRNTRILTFMGLLFITAYIAIIMIAAFSKEKINGASKASQTDQMENILSEQN